MTSGQGARVLWAEPVARPGVAGVVAPSAWPVVGRARELAEMEACLGRDGGRGLFLAGAAGAGKSALARECARIGALAGFRCERVLATRSASAIPLGALAPILPPATPMPRHADLLASAIAALSGGDGRLLLVVDDGHLLDDASASVVHHLAREGLAVVVMTACTGEPAPEEVVALWKDGLVERIDIGPLGQRDVNELLDTVLDGAVDGATRQDLWEASQGNPLFLRELVLGSLDADVLRFEGGIWRLTRSLAATPRLLELVEARLADLTADERAVLELLAVGEPLELDALARLEASLGMLDGLERRGLVQVTIDGRRPLVRLSHPLHGEVLRGAMTAMGRMVAARRLAAAVEPGAGDEDLVRVAVWCLEGGGTVDPAAMLVAARRVHFAHDNPLAERLARAALEAGGGVVAGLLLAQILGEAGRHQDRHVLLCELQADATAEHQASIAMEQALTLFCGLGRGDAAERVLRDTEAVLPLGPARDEVTAQRATLELLAGHFTRAVATAGPLLARDPTSRAGVTAAIAMAPALGVCGRGDEALAVADRALAAHLALGDQEVMSEAWIHNVSRALVLLEAGRLAEADATATAGYHAALAGHIATGQAWFALLRGLVGLATGELAAATDWFREGAAVYTHLGQDGPRRWCLAGRALAAGMCADAVEAAAAVADLDAVGDNPMLMMEPDVLRGRAWAALAAGDRQAARQLLLGAARSAETAGALALAGKAWHDLARLGHPDVAVEPLARLARETDGPLGGLRASHAAALVAQEPDALSRVADGFEAIGATLAAAEAAAAAAGAAARRQRAREAAAFARRARMLAARCHGARTPELELAGPARDLTRRERQVAIPAARGEPNKSIARRLGVAVRTVETHLQTAYGKLGVSDRTGLRDALRDLDLAGTE